MSSPPDDAGAPAAARAALEDDSSDLVQFALPDDRPSFAAGLERGVRYPALALLIAAATGFLLGRLLRR